MEKPVLRGLDKSIPECSARSDPKSGLKGRFSAAPQSRSSRDESVKLIKAYSVGITTEPLTPDNTSLPRLWPLIDYNEAPQAVTQDSLLMLIMDRSVLISVKRLFVIYPETSGGFKPLPSRRF